jgi:hypothetical protein
MFVSMQARNRFLVGRKYSQHSGECWLAEVRGVQLTYVLVDGCLLHLPYFW